MITSTKVIRELERARQHLREYETAGGLNPLVNARRCINRVCKYEENRHRNRNANFDKAKYIEQMGAGGRI